MHLKLSSAKWRPFCFGLNVLSYSMYFLVYALTSVVTYYTHTWCQHMLDQLYMRVIAVHDDVIKWKHFPRNWPFVREIHRSPVNFPHKGQWRGALMYSLIYAWINDWVNNHEAGDLRRQHGHYDVIVMSWSKVKSDIFSKSMLAKYSRWRQIYRIRQMPPFRDWSVARRFAWNQVFN